MSLPGKSRWGSLLQQAVAGVEARLDNILAEGEAGSNNSATEASKPEAPLGPGSVGPSANVSRSSSTRQHNKLQARLAKAVASKTSPRTSTSFELGDHESANDVGLEASSTSDVSKIVVGSNSVKDTNESETSSEVPDNMDDLSLDDESNWKKDHNKTAKESPSVNIQETLFNDVTSTLHTDHTATRSPQPEPFNVNNDEDIKEYMERIDSLAAKVKFLSQTVTETAKNRAASATSDQERIVAEKDQRIALLMGEGQALTLADQKSRAAVKRFKAKLSEKEKLVTELRRELGQVKVDCANLQKTTKRYLDLERKCEAAELSVGRLQSEVSTLKFDLDVKESTITKLNADIQLLADYHDESAHKANAEQAGSHAQKANELADTIASMEIEKHLAAERSRKQITDVKEQLKQAVSTARATENELKSEIQGLERKLEALRVYAEEVSSTSKGGADVKMIRQIETLHSQHAIATENWKSIEASLLARVSNLEMERDEAIRRESDMRKKARDSYRAQEEELSQLQAKISLMKSKPDDQSVVAKLKDEIETLRSKVSEKDAALTQLKTEMEQKQNEWRASTARPESEEWPVNEDNRSLGVPISSPVRPSSPQFSHRSRNFSADVLSNPRYRKSSVPGVLGFDQDRSVSRWTGHLVSLKAPTQSISARSGHGLISPSLESLIDQPLSLLAGIGEIGDAFDDADRPSSPQRPANDMVSVSTVAAGPSIQLVDRLSAAVRRLEAEKVAAKEEMTRIASQRDEARVEISTLMKEIQEVQHTKMRVSELEGEIEDMTRRYQITLEMLGEKSELVEELRADIADVKAMYRELVESTVGK